MKRADAPVAREVLTTLLTKAKAGTVKGIYKRLAPGTDGRLRYVLQPAATDTGRMACGDTFLEPSTNVQNLPNKIAALDPLYRVRDVIVPAPGRMLGEADYSQAEARVAAWMARDPLAIYQYEHDVDRYVVLACEIYGKPAGAVTKAERFVGKMGQLAFQYGVGWATFMEQVNADADITGVTISAAIAKRAEAAFRSMHPRYVAWWDEVFAEVVDRGYLRNPLDRRRDFLAPLRGDKGSRDALRRQAVAFLPQSTIADLLNSRLVELYRLHDPKDLRLLVQVHDAILFDCEPRRHREVARIVKRVLEDHELVIHGKPLRVPCEIEMSLTSWAAKRKVAA